MKESVKKAYEIAKERYAAFGIDTEKVLEQLQDFHLSMHCWQADDVAGFESTGDLTGGIQATGNYPGKARTPDELMADITLGVTEEEEERYSQLKLKLGTDSERIWVNPRNL